MIYITQNQVKEFGGRIIATFDSTYIKSFGGMIQYKIDGFLTRREMMALLALIYAS